MIVRVVPSKHAYYAGETASLRIDLARGAGEAHAEEDERRTRLGLVGIPSFLADGDTPIPPGEHAQQTPIPRHHPHARKPSLAHQEPHPTEQHPLPPIAESSDADLDLDTSPSANPEPILIEFATVQIRGHLIPSPSHIPPEPLLPLRTLLLHQPIGSSSAPPPPPTTSWTPAVDFTGAAEGTLTTSLGTLARGLFAPGSGEGTWDDHRKAAWLARELPVWISPRDVVCVDAPLVGTMSYTYEVQIPPLLPPTWKGRSLVFGYTIHLSLTLAVPTAPAPAAHESRRWSLFPRVVGQAVQKRPQRTVTREIDVPLRVLSRVTVPPTTETYDLLRPVIPRRSDGCVTPLLNDRGVKPVARRDGSELKEFVERVVAELQPKTSTTDVKGVKEVKQMNGTDSGVDAEVGSISVRDDNPSDDNRKDIDTSTSEPGETRLPPPESESMKTETPVPRRLHAIERLEGTEAILTLLRASRPGRFEIVKKHHQIAVLSLPKTAYRTGEAVHGLIEFHAPGTRYDVLKLSIDLITNETIPPPLLPHTTTTMPPPALRRTIAQSGNGYTLDLASVGFSLGIPPNGTAAFEICVGNAPGETGGLGWALHLRFLVRLRSGDRTSAGEKGDNVGYQRSGMTGDLVRVGEAEDGELDVDIVECMIPLTVYPSDEGKVDVSEFRV